MARRKKDVADEGLKARRRKLKSRERRERKKEGREEAQAGPLDTTWLRSIMTVSHARKIIDREKDRPYWLSIPFAVGDGNPPVAEVSPCTMFRTRERVYYGFLFRGHRELALYSLKEARRELTSTIQSKFPQLLL